MKPSIKVPIKIITKKIAQNKQNSFFYAGKNIAEVKIQNRTYVLTTSGHYSFSLKENGPNISFDSTDRNILSKRPYAKAFRFLTDAKIKTIGDNDLASNWGWFGINVWEDTNTKWDDSIPAEDQSASNEKLLPYPTEVWSNYDEAMEAFINLIEKDLIQ